MSSQGFLPQRQLFFAGVKSVTPLLIGIAPFALIAGAAAVAAGLPLLLAHALSFVVFAGAAQLVTLELIGRDAPMAVIVFTALLINLRMMMYSASIAPHFKDLSARWKAGVAYLLTDQAYAMAMVRFKNEIPEEGKAWYYIGAGLPLWIIWQIGTAIGIYLGAVVPSGLGLEFTIPLMFMGLLFPLVRGRPSWIAAVTGGLIAVALYPLPFNLGFIIAAFVGALAGVWAERWTS